MAEVKQAEGARGGRQSMSCTLPLLDGHAGRQRIRRVAGPHGVGIAEAARERDLAEGHVGHGQARMVAAHAHRDEAPARPDGCHRRLWPHTQQCPLMRSADCWRLPWQHMLPGLRMQSMTAVTAWLATLLAGTKAHA